MMGKVVALGVLVMIGVLATLAAQTPISQVTPFPLAQATSGDVQNSYYAEPVLSWDVHSHKVMFGVKFIVGDALSLKYYGKVWIQLYYQEVPSSKGSPQLLYQRNASIEEFVVKDWNASQRNLTWQRSYTFTTWNDGKHDLIVNLNWYDNLNLTNWSNLDGLPLSPFSVWNGSMCTHHIDWTETVDFTTPVSPPPHDATAGIVVGGFFLVLGVGAVVSEASHKLRKLHRRRR